MAEASTWSLLLPVVVGGVIAVAGAISGPPLNHWLSARTEAEKRRREKMEQLLAILGEHQHWMALSKDVQLFDAPGPLAPPPFPKARAIASLYFPEIDAHFLYLEQAWRRHDSWVATSKRDLTLNKGSSIDLEEFARLASEYVDQDTQVRIALRQIARKEMVSPPKN